MVIWCVPTASEPTGSEAVPKEESETPPSELVPSMNCTVPKGGYSPVASPPAVAVKVTTCPTVAGLAEAVTWNAGSALLAVSVTVEDELPFNVELPPYTAVSECAPAEGII